MTMFDQFWIRTASTLTATLATVLIITERHRRIANAKVELAARHLETIEQENNRESREQGVVRDVQLAENLVQDVVWSRVARASKIEEVMHVTRELRHVRHTYERIETTDEPDKAEAVIARDVAERKFSRLANEVRKLKVSLIDFIFVHSTPPARR